MGRKQLCFWILRMGCSLKIKTKRKTLQETDHGHDGQSIQPKIKQQPQIILHCGTNKEPHRHHVMSCLSALKLQHCYEADKKQNQFMCCQYNIVGVQINAMLCLLSNKQKKKKLDDLKALKLSFLNLK